MARLNSCIREALEQAVFHAEHGRYSLAAHHIASFTWSMWLSDEVIDGTIVPAFRAFKHAADRPPEDTV